MAASPPDVAFDWDRANIAHLKRHRIKSSEAEEVVLNEPVIQAYEGESGEDRWTALGVTNLMRVLVIVFAVGDGCIRVITGWDADRQTKKAYFEERGT